MYCYRLKSICSKIFFLKPFYYIDKDHRVIIDNIVILAKHHSPSHVFGDERMVVKYMQLCALFSPFILLREGKRYEVMPEIKRNARSFILVLKIINFKRHYKFYFKDTHKGEKKEKITYFFIPFSKVSRTSVEASLIYVLVDVPLIPDASLKLDRRDCSGTDKCATERKSFRIKDIRDERKIQKKREADRQINQIDTTSLEILL